MIITHITADNLLKYTHLELTEIPRQGVITISGQNESGKSTIGETVCFALFGRTFSIGDDEITRVIRWGESRCSVSLGFAIGDKDYVIARFLDNEGNHGARLYLAGDEEHPIAKGVNAVSEALDELLGYQFEEFVESFYLAQREITTPHPHSNAIKTMAGISALERVAEEISYDVKNEKRKISDVTEQIEMTEADVEALNIEAGEFDELQTQLETIKQTGRSLHESSEGLSVAARNYLACIPRFKPSQAIKHFSKLLFLVALFAALASGIAWYLNNSTPDLEESFMPLLELTFTISTAAALVFWLISSVMKKKINTMQKTADVLAEQIKAVSSDDAISVQHVDGQDDPDTKAAEEPDINSIANDSNTLKTDETDHLSAILQYNLDQEGTNLLISDLQQQLQERINSQQQSQATFEASLSKEQEKLTRADVLNDVIGKLKDKLDQLMQKVRVSEIADELISAAGRNFSQRFNIDLRELASRTLPLFTEDRYEHLHIDNDLNVRAFSNLKRDYMDLDEISSGTQRQIMLAVRLALSQELVNTTSGGDQFIFLDEPFAFFDETRTRNAMAILPKLSKEIRQIWVVAQSFPEDTVFDRAIVCSREFDSLPPVTSPEEDS